MLHRSSVRNNGIDERAMSWPHSITQLLIVFISYNSIFGCMSNVQASGKLRKPALASRTSQSRVYRDKNTCSAALVRFH
jgi:hypothetical protein